MVWEVWSVGDYRFLAEVLNSVAAWAGTGSPARIASIGLIVSILILSFQGILQGGRMPQYQNIILGWIFYAFLFGPGVTVHVRDTYNTLNVEVVDNVPVGLAATGSILSRLTHYITDEMKVAFSLPTMVDDIFGGALKILADSRNLAFPSQQGQLHRSVINYISDCTNIGLLRNEKKINDILRNTASPLEAVRWDSNVYTTQILLPGDPDDPAAISCTDAYARLATHFNSAAFWAEWDTYLQGRYETDFPTTQMQNVLDTMVTGSVDAKDFMMASTMHQLFISAQKTGNLALSDPVLAASISEALAGRDFQMASDAQFFKRIARPGMSFFESATYTVAPFMALLVVLVPMGISLMVKYFMLNVWVQLWMPSLAILNYMGNFVLQGKVAAVANNGPVTSLLGAQDVYLVAQDWMSTVNTLASIVPLFTMFLVSGSMMLGSAFASRMSSDDHFNEKNMAPDMLKNNPVMTSSMGSFEATAGGMSQKGAVSPNWSTSSGITSSVQSAGQELVQSGSELSEAYMTALKNSQGFSESGSNVESFSKSTSLDNSQTGSFMRQKAEAIKSKLGISDVSTDDLATTLAYDMKGNIGGGKGLSGSIGGSATQQLMARSSSQTATGTDVTSDAAFRLSDEEKKSFTKAMSTDLKTTGTTAFSTDESLSKDQSVSERLSKAAAASQSYTVATGLQKSFSQNIDANAADAGAFASRRGMDVEMYGMANKHNIMDKANNLAGWYAREHGSSEHSLNRGIFHALWDKAQGGDMVAMNDLNRLTGKAYGHNVATPTGDIYGNQNITKGVIPGSIATDVDAGAAARMAAHGANNPASGQYKPNNIGNKTAVGGMMGAVIASADETHGMLGNHLDQNPSAARTVGSKIASGIDAMDMQVAALQKTGVGGAAMSGAIEGWNTAKEEFMEQVAQHPNDGSLWDRFKSSVGKIQASFAGALDGGIDGAKSGNAEIDQQIVGSFMEKYRSEAQGYGLTGDSAEMYARSRFNDAAAALPRAEGGIASGLFGATAFGTTYNALTETGRVATPTALDVQQGLSVNPMVQQVVMHAASTGDTSGLHLAGAYQGQLDRLQSMDSDNRQYAWQSTGGGGGGTHAPVVNIQESPSKPSPATAVKLKNAFGSM